MEMNELLCVMTSCMAINLLVFEPIIASEPSILSEHISSVVDT